MRHERGHDVLHGHVLVDVAGDAQRPELADLISVGDGAAEDHDRRPVLVHLAERAQHGHAVALWQPQIEHDQVNLVLAGAHAAKQFGSVLRCDSFVTGPFDRHSEPSRTNAVSSATRTVFAVTFGVVVILISIGTAVHTVADCRPRIPKSGGSSI